MKVLGTPVPGSAPRSLFSYRKYWACRFGTASFLPMSRAEMATLGWDSCDIILVTGDAYIDHPSFGMALIGRLLEAQGFRVGIISQPDWRSAASFRALGRPNLFFGVTAGNMDSMVNRYTADRKPRSDDAYTPNGEPNRRPDRAVVVYAQRCREAFPGSNVVIGSIEASLRRIAHYDYWSDKVRRSVLPDAKADLLIYGSAERAIVDGDDVFRGNAGHQVEHVAIPAEQHDVQFGARVARAQQGEHRLRKHQTAHLREQDHDDPPRRELRHRAARAQPVDQRGEGAQRYAQVAIDRALQLQVHFSHAGGR